MSTYHSASNLFKALAEEGHSPDVVAAGVLEHWGRGLRALLGTPLGFALERATLRTPSFRTLFLV